VTSGSEKSGASDRRHGAAGEPAQPGRILSPGVTSGHRMSAKCPVCSTSVGAGIAETVTKSCGRCAGGRHDSGHFADILCPLVNFRPKFVTRLSTSHLRYLDTIFLFRDMGDKNLLYRCLGENCVCILSVEPFTCMGNLGKSLSRLSFCHGLRFRIGYLATFRVRRPLPLMLFHHGDSCLNSEDPLRPPALVFYPLWIRARMDAATRRMVLLWWGRLAG
jgi:hypothetical protein